MKFQKSCVIYLFSHFSVSRTKILVPHFLKSCINIRNSCITYCSTFTVSGMTLRDSCVTIHKSCFKHNSCFTHACKRLVGDWNRRATFPTGRIEVWFLLIHRNFHHFVIVNFLIWNLDNLLLLVCLFLWPAWDLNSTKRLNRSWYSHL